MVTRHRFTSLCWWVLPAIAGLLLTFAILPARSGARESVIRRAAAGRLRPAVLITPGGIKRTMPLISSGVLAAEVDTARYNATPSGAAAPEAAPITGIDDESLGCSRRTSEDDVRVNQDCSFRLQGEEQVKINPTNARNLIAGQNDQRTGFNRCSFAYSFDGGKTWGDDQPPFYQRVNNPPPDHSVAGGEGTGGAYQRGSDPALTFDSRGNAYFSCVTFDNNTNASAVLVTRSPAPAGGSFYNNVPPAGTAYVAVEDNSPAAQHDKEFIVADSFRTSPFRDNVYVTWTVFNFTCGPQGDQFCSGAIYFSRSTDKAVTWSKPKEISGNNPDLCFFGNFFDPARNEHDCDFDQGSDPIVLPDGTIVVVFNNGNTPEGNPNAQQLAVVSKDGGETWSKPVKVGDDIVVNEPVCDFGRGPEECIPGAFVRTNDFPRIAVDKANGDVYAVWQDYRTGAFDIILSKSTNGGRSWKEATQPANPSRNLDHSQPAIDVGDHQKVAVSYYRTGRVPNENHSPKDGFRPGRDPGVQRRDSDYFLAGGKDLNTPFTHTRVARPFPPPDGVQAGFMGDYSGLAALGDKAIPIWADTRNTAIAEQGASHDEDVFISILDIPGD
jgi:hypothetical protein